MLTLTCHQRNENQNYAKTPALSQRMTVKAQGSSGRGKADYESHSIKEISGHTRAGDCDRWNPEQMQGRQSPSMEVGLWGQNPSTN